MFAIKNRIYGFKICQIWFAQQPVDTKGFDRTMFYCCKKDGEFAGFKKYTSYANIIDLTQPIEKIRKGFNDTTRNEIRRAEKEGIQFKVNSDYDEFLKLFNQFIKRKKLKLPKMTKENLEMQKHFLFTAHYKGKLISAHYYLVEDDLIWLLFSCSMEPNSEINRQYLSYSSRYLHYKAIEYAKDKNYRQFSFSSIGNGKSEFGSSIAKFKLGFGGEIIEKKFYIKDYSPILKSVQYVKSLI
ncbi:MAG: hypothetical protein ABR981_01090 [Candidatus Micrarchaeaceae archaeon]|jgi:hypothetical protein